MPNQSQQQNLPAKDALRKDALLLTSFFVADSETPYLVRYRSSEIEDYSLMMYKQDRGIYVRLTYTSFSTIFQSFLTKNAITELWMSQRIRSVYDAILSSSDNTIVRELTGTPKYPNLICFRDLILEWTTGQVQPHTPELFFLSQVNVKYTDVADAIANKTDCPYFLKFLGDIMPDIADQDNLIKLGGYLMYQGGNPAGKIFTFIGEGANGKSMLLDIYQEVFGGQMSPCISYLSLEEMSEVEGHSRGLLENSQINLVAEQRGSKIDWEEIKKIIDGVAIKVNPKFIKPYFITPRCKLIMASNEIPYIKDRTHAAVRRLYSLRFSSTFVTPEYMAELVNRGTDIEENRFFLLRPAEEMMAEFRAELPVICGIFLEGLRRLAKDKWIFPETKAVIATKEEFAVETDIAKHWIKNYLIIGGVDDFLSSAEVYALFSQFYDDHTGGDEKSKPKKHTVSKRIVQILNLKPKVKRVEGKIVKGFHLKYRNPDTLPEETLYDQETV